MAEIFGLDGKRIESPKPKRNKRVMRAIKRLLSHNEDGRIRSIFAVFITSEGYPGYSFSSDGPVDSSQLIGALELAKAALIEETIYPSNSGSEEDFPL